MIAFYYTYFQKLLRGLPASFIPPRPPSLSLPPPPPPHPPPHFSLLPCLPSNAFQDSPAHSGQEVLSKLPTVFLRTFFFISGKENSSPFFSIINHLCPPSHIFPWLNNINAFILSLFLFHWYYLVSINPFPKKFYKNIFLNQVFFFFSHI